MPADPIRGCKDDSTDSTETIDLRLSGHRNGRRLELLPFWPNTIAAFNNRQLAVSLRRPPDGRPVARMQPVVAGLQQQQSNGILGVPLTAPATGRDEHGFRPWSPRLGMVGAPSQGPQDVAMSYYRERAPHRSTTEKPPEHMTGHSFALRIALGCAVALTAGVSPCEAQDAPAGQALPARREFESRAEIEAQAKAAEAQHRPNEAWLLRQRLEKGDFQDGDRIIVVLHGNALMPKDFTGISDTLFTVRAGRRLEFPRMADLPLDGVLRSELNDKLTAALCPIHSRTLGEKHAARAHCGLGPRRKARIRLHASRRAAQRRNHGGGWSGGGCEHGWNRDSARRRRHLGCAGHTRGVGGWHVAGSSPFARG